MKQRGFAATIGTENELLSSQAAFEIDQAPEIVDVKALKHVWLFLSRRAAQRQLPTFFAAVLEQIATGSFYLPKRGTGYVAFRDEAGKKIGRELQRFDPAAPAMVPTFEL